MSAWETIRLVALREITTRLRSRAFLVATAGLVAAIIIGGVLLKLAGGSEPAKVGFTAEAASMRAPVAALMSEAEDADGADDGGIRTQEVTRSEGERLVRSGDLDAVVDGGPGDLELLVKETADQSLRSALTAVAQQQALSAKITELGGDPAEVASDVAAAAPTVVALKPQDREPAQIVAGYLVGMLVFLGIATTGQMVAQGVVEEKTSRVVELLLAAVRPWQLMAGKVVGIGVVGMAQVGAILGASVGMTLALGLLDPGTLNLGVTAISTLAWFVIGYLTFSLALAGLASLVSRQEDVGSVIAPVMTVMVIPYIVAVSIGTMEPDHPLVATLSFIPLASPLVMPVRIAGDAAAAWEVVLSMGISIAVIPLLVWLTGRMYGNAVLRTGARVKVRQALRG